MFILLQIVGVSSILILKENNVFSNSLLGATIYNASMKERNTDFICCYDLSFKLKKTYILQILVCAHTKTNLLQNSYTFYKTNILYMVLSALESFIIFFMLHDCVTCNYYIWNYITLLLLSSKMMKMKTEDKTKIEKKAKEDENK